MKLPSTLLVVSLAISGCAMEQDSEIQASAPPLVTKALQSQDVRMMASYYGPGFQGHRTASGEKFDRHGFTAAHMKYPFGTRLKITNPDNGRSVLVRVNDRGPFSKIYSLDLSEAASFQIGRKSSGPVMVTIAE